tara:strand:- start:5492 stop:6079 length:588 start_codon:yes stop_codon:yes gene_type:complete
LKNNIIHKIKKGTMGKIISSIWQSMDGVVEAETMDKWFMPFDSEQRGKYINEIIENCDAMLYGRKTYEMLSGYWSQQKNNEFGIADKLNSTKKYLVSTTLKKADWGETEIISKDIVKKVSEIKENSTENILIQGSVSIVNLLLQNGLIDELRLLVNPYIMGVGKQLFEKELNISLKLADTKALENGVVALKYDLI